jgi:hypothetical protein
MYCACFNFFFFFVTSLSFRVRIIYTHINIVITEVCDMLTYIRVNLSLMLSITTASYVEIMGNHRDGRVRTARGEKYI